MKIVAISDLHGYLPKIPPADLLLIAGDICPTESHAIRFQAQWLDRVFRLWLNVVPAKAIVGIAGNHDFIFENAPDLVPQSLSWTYLQDSGMEVAGLKLYGSPHQLRFHDWAFNLDEPDLAKKWELIPDDTDILITHGPPHEFGDAAPRGRNSFENVGSPSLLKRIQEVKPKLAVFGHIHEGRGRWQVGETTLANVTLLDGQYRPVHAPMEFTLG